MVVNIKSESLQGHTCLAPWVHEITINTILMSPLKPVTMERSPPEHTWGSDTHRSRHKRATAEGAGPRQRPLQIQAQVRGLQGTRPEPQTSTGPGPSQEHLQKQAWAGYIHQSKPETVISTEVSTREPPVREQDQARDLRCTRHESVTWGSSPDLETSS